MTSDAYQKSELNDQRKVDGNCDEEGCKQVNIAEGEKCQHMEASREEFEVFIPEWLRKFSFIQDLKKQMELKRDILSTEQEVPSPIEKPEDTRHMNQAFDDPQEGVSTGKSRADIVNSMGEIEDSSQEINQCLKEDKDEVEADLFQGSNMIFSTGSSQRYSVASDEPLQQFSPHGLDITVGSRGRGEPAQESVQSLKDAADFDLETYAQQSQMFFSTGKPKVPLVDRLKGGQGSLGKRRVEVEQPQDLISMLSREVHNHKLEPIIFPEEKGLIRLAGIKNHNYGFRNVELERQKEREAKANFALTLSLFEKKPSWLISFQEYPTYWASSQCRIYRVPTQTESGGCANVGSVSLPNGSLVNKTLLDVYAMLSQLDKQSAVVRIEEEFKYASSGMPALKSNARRGWIDPQVRFPPDSILLHDELEVPCSVLLPVPVVASEKKSSGKELEYYLTRFSNFLFPKLEYGYLYPLPWDRKLSFWGRNSFIRDNNPIFLTSDLPLALANVDSSNINWIAWDGDIENTSFEKLKGKIVHLFDSGSDLKLYRKNMHLVYSVLTRYGVTLGGFIRANGEFRDSSQYEYESITYAQHQYGIGKKKALKSKYVVQSIEDISVDNVAVNYVDPVFSHPSISMIYADPGVGKTWFALALALACSTGVDVFPKWGVPEALNVLYVDGETGAEELGKRIQKLKKLYSDVNAQFAFICTSEMNIATEGDQKFLESVLKGHQKEWSDKSKCLLILDNLSTLTKFDDSVSSWTLIFSWLKKMKDDGINSIVIHHPNKKGDQRGSSIKTATLDNVLKLDRFTDGAALDFSIKIEKARAIERKHQRQFNVELKNVDRNPKWVRYSVQVTKSERDEEIVRLSKEGCREQVIADKVDCSIATVKRVRRKFGLTKVRSTK